MSKRKGNIRLPPRVRSYVSRESGAAELDISPQTWDRWVKEGRLPPAAPGFPESIRRWRWKDVDGRMSGRPDDDTDEFVKRTATMRHSLSTDDIRKAHDAALTVVEELAKPLSGKTRARRRSGFR